MRGLGKKEGDILFMRTTKGVSVWRSSSVNR